MKQEPPKPGPAGTGRDSGRPGDDGPADAAGAVAAGEVSSAQDARVRPTKAGLVAPAPESRSRKAAMRAVLDAIVEETPEHVIFDPQALDRAYELLLAADPQRKRASACGKVSIGFPVRGEDYEDAPDEC